MAAEDGLELPVGLTEKQFLQQVARLENRLAKMEGETITRFKKVNSGISKTFDDLENRVSKNFRGIAAAPLAAITAALGAGQIIKLTGQWTDLTSRVNLAAGSMEKGADVMQRVSEMARRTYSDLTLTAEGYMAFSTVLTDLGVATNKQLDFVESLNNALVVSGAKGETAARVMDALSKAMALGKLSGDNLNTVIASGGRVAQALAQSMGVTTLELRKLGTDGKIGRAELLNITSQMEKLRTEAAEMPATIQDGFMLLNNALLEYIGRGDEAVGISAMIADALIIIADNFEEVADTALKAAAVIAAAFMGRSIAGMIVGLGSATGAVTKLLAALRGASTVSGFAGALTSLGAAAGPLGMILGGVLAGGLIYFGGRAREAERTSEDFRKELERLGLYAPKVVEANEAVAKSIDEMTSQEKLRQIRLLQEGLDALRGGGIFDNSELDKILAEARKGVGIEAGWIGWSAFESGDKEALKRIREIGFAYQASEVSAQEFHAEAAKILDMDMSSQARKLAEELVDVAARADAGATALGALGRTPGLREAEDQLQALKEELIRIRDVSGFDAEITDAMTRIIGQLERAEITAEQAEAAMRELGAVEDISTSIVAATIKIIEEFQASERSAESARSAIEAIADAYPDVTGLLDTVAPIFAMLASLRLEALATAEAVAAAVRAKVAEEGYASMGGGTDRGAEERRKAYLARQEEQAALKAYTAEQDRQNNLTRDQIALEKEAAQVRKEMIEAGIARPDQDTVNQIAEGRLAADEARRDAGKKGKGGGKGKKDKDDKKLEGLIEDLKTEREILDEWYKENLRLLEEASEKELEILGGRDAAKERLEEEHQERMKRIKDAANQFNLQQALGAGADVLGAMGAFNKKALKMSQSFAAAEALVSAYQGAAEELKKGVLGIKTGALVLAKGFAFAAAIRGVSEGGGGGGRGGGASSAPEAPAQSASKVANYQISGDVLGKQSTDALFRQINEGVKDGYTIHNVEWV
ncbi:tape measure protein [Rhodobacter sp. 24-YEA-8]|uniref:tape measure protein n=1 Tax=Rhodobacter sp. 24-YEA-8 TaxID=1884310 RepID=UPI000896423D|nr:tape measure protein [Rhodobacter sp. 24-YEA-8]SEB79688.1 tape measure domain-containing protein [Rhodobacter sp. 24-YEA-8]